MFNFHHKGGEVEFFSYQLSEGNRVLKMYLIVMHKIYYNETLKLKLLENDTICRAIEKTKSLTHFLTIWDTIPILLKYLYPGSIVMDVGAFVGDSTQYFLDKGSIVYAFEPNYEPYVCLLYNCPQAIPINRPLGKYGQLVYAAWSDTNSHKLGGQAYHIEDHGLADECDVPQYEMSLDQFIHLEKCDVLKLDAEGAEYRILDNGRKFIEKYKPFIITEIKRRQLRKNGSSSKAYQQLLTKLDYVHIATIGDDYFYQHALRI